MRMLLVFFLSYKHPGPLILNYLVALRKGSVWSEPSDDTGTCWTVSHSASESSEVRQRPSSFQPCVLLSG